MYDEYNVRQYVLHRDGYTCQCCKAKPSAKHEVKLHVHHLESRQIGGNAPNNLITLCESCHKKLHKGLITLNGKKRGKAFRDAAFMGIMRKTLMQRLRTELSIPVEETYGYITKYIRETNSIPKSHTNDARCIAKYPHAAENDTVFYARALRHHNRQLHKANPIKGGIRKRNQVPYKMFGFRLWDKVRFKGTECFISARRSSGSFALRTFNGKMVSAGVTYKKLRFLEEPTNYICERRTAVSSHG